jgi:hypothetical protein
VGADGGWAGDAVRLVAKRAEFGLAAEWLSEKFLSRPCGREKKRREQLAELGLSGLVPVYVINLFNIYRSPLGVGSLLVPFVA